MQDSGNNTYTCLRTVRTGKDAENSMYCYFVDNENFVEVYDLTADPFQLENQAKTTQVEKLDSYRQTIKDIKSTLNGKAKLHSANEPSDQSDWLNRLLASISVSVI